MRTKWFAVVLLLLVLVSWAYGGSAGIQITAPQPGSLLRPGALMKLKVDPQGLPVSSVTYLLLEQDRALEDKVEPPPSASVEIPPFEAEMMVPPEGVGPYRLLAVSRITERRGFYILFDEAPFLVSPEAPLTALRAESPLRFTKTIGEVQILTVRGVYADKIVRDVTSSATGTVYHSSNESVVRVNWDGRAQAVGEGTAEITVRNQGRTDRIRVVVEVRDSDNLPPVADAGVDQTVRQGTRVRLDAIGSADPEGENPYYYWSQVKGMPIDLVEPLSLRPYFIAPIVMRPQVLRFRLIVKDKEEAESFPAYVNVTVVP